MEKITKRQRFEAIKAQLTNKEDIDFINHEIELLAKKNASRSEKPTAKQKENEVLKQAILDGMEDGVAYQINALMKQVPEVAELSNQRVSALVRQLKEDGKVIKEIVKRVSFYKKADGVGEGV